ncbi:hypothetical protein ACFLUA_04860 [Chloroflexota bacterium]
MNIIRNSLIVSLLVVLVLPTSFAFAAGIEDVKGVNYTHCPVIGLAQAGSGGFSGDDLYDSAVDLLCAEASLEINAFSANPELSVAGRNSVAAPLSAEINSIPANLLGFWSPPIYADVAPVSAEINSFSANPELSVAGRNSVAAPLSAEINSIPANLLGFWSPPIYADVAPVSSEINAFSANPELSVAQFTTDVSPVSAETDTFNPLSFWTPQIYADVAPVSAETKDCFADCYDNY